jgi:ureidoacrylate peracid hydrolase
MHRIDLPAWAIERGKTLNHFTRIDVERSALLAIDMQNAFMTPGEVFANPHARDIVPHVNQLAATLRAACGTVVWTRQTISADATFAYPDWQFNEKIPAVKAAKKALTEGAFGHALYANMEIHRADIVLNKHRYSPFIPPSSPLDAMLKSRGIDTLIVTGTLTNCCCECAARDANMLGYKVFFVSDATAAVTDEEHNAALLNLVLMFADVRSTADMLHLIAACTADAQHGRD